MDATIRTMQTHDVPAADAIRSAAGWNQVAADWYRLIDHEPEGCFVATINNEVVGSVTTTVYGSALAWIGMVLVREDQRGQGIGRQLMQHALEFLKTRTCPCIRLDATPLGRGLYEKLGFVPEWGFHRWQRGITTQAAPRGHDVATRHVDRQPDATRMLAEHRGLDTTAFGADRHTWLTRLATSSTCLSRKDGFGMFRQGAVARYLGPVTSASMSTAADICMSVPDGSDGPVFWDVPEVNSAAQRLAEQLGFAPGRPLLRMRYGTDKVAPQLHLQYAIADPGTG